MSTSKGPIHGLNATLFTLVLAVLMFIAFFDNFAQLPLVSPMAHALGASGALIGWIVGAYSLTNILGNAVAGWSLDRWGRPWLLSVGFLWAGVGVLLYVFVQSPQAYLLARAFHGFGGGILVPAVFTVAGDAFSGLERARAMGRIGAMIGLAAVVAPAYSGVVRELLGADAVFLTVSVLMAIGAVVAWLVLGRRLALVDTSRTSEPARETPIPVAGQVLFLACLGAVLLSCAQGALALLLPLHAEGIGYSSTRVGMLFSVFAVFAIIVMLVIPGRRETSVVRDRVVPFGLVCVGLSFFGLSVAEAITAMVAWMALFGCGFGLIYPALNTAVAGATGRARRGKAFGAFYACFSLGFVIAPPILGAFSVGVGSISLSFALTGTLMLLGSTPFWRRSGATLAAS